jgi:predicted SAM-dependent methyltransferase
VLCRLFLDPRATSQDRFDLMRMIFGAQVDPYDFHKVGLTAELMNRLLFDAGFSRVERVKRFALFDDASRQEMMGTPVSLNMTAYK